ncbi:MAG: signal peptidase [Frankiaceae bacterium]|nr:signal peptidase [Frankiaceae bacterium]
MHPSEPTHPAEPETAGSAAEPVDAADDGAAPATPPPGKTSFWKELPFLVLIALVLALLIKTFLVQAFYIPSASMENTLQGGPVGAPAAGPTHHPYDRVLVNKLIYRIRDIHRGEIVVFKGPKSWQEQPEFVSHAPSNPVARFFHDIGSAIGVAAPSSKDFIKRVIGVGGDTVRCTNDQLYVNNVRLVEPYLPRSVHECTDGFQAPWSVTVPKGRLWVMGDNRSGSADSRAHFFDGNHGTIPASDVIGRAFVVVWPPSDWKTLPVPGTFHQKGLAAAMSAATSDPLVLGFVGAVPLTVLRRRVSYRRRLRRLSAG